MNHKHDDVIFRKRGNRVRHQCSTCSRVTRWEHSPVEEGRINFNTLTIPQLLKYAEENHIDVRKSWTKAHIIEVITDWSSENRSVA